MRIALSVGLPVAARFSEVAAAASAATTTRASVNSSGIGGTGTSISNRLALSDEMAAILTGERKTVVLVTHDIGEAISMADRVVVMSRRPGRIKSVHSIAYPSFGLDRPTPFQARKCPEFSGYFQLIWDELDVHQVQ